MDPPGCKDIDDALHVRPLGPNRTEVGVHIADVTHFVPPGNACDEEARFRGTSVYLVQRRIDMLPTLLTTDLCSLVGNKERLAFSVVWVMDDDANILDVRFHKSVIKSCAAMTYVSSPKYRRPQIPIKADDYLFLPLFSLLFSLLFPSYFPLVSLLVSRRPTKKWREHYRRTKTLMMQVWQGPVDD